MNATNPGLGDSALASSASDKMESGARAEENLFEPEVYEQIATVIRQRRTWKLIAHGAEVREAGASPDANLCAGVWRAINDAGWAPFHYPRGCNAIAEPWRVHILWSDTCQEIARQLPGWFSDINAQNKLAGLLVACDALVLVNWIPQLEVADRVDQSSKAKLMQVNEEHLAATAAFVQNLLILLTAQNLKSYWSSGGFFREPTMFEKLGIEKHQKLLAAVFVNQHGKLTNASEFQIVPGKLRPHRSAATAWTRETKLA
jgi:hypothetical protein